MQYSLWLNALLELEAHVGDQLFIVLLLISLSLVCLGKMMLASVWVKGRASPWQLLIVEPKMFKTSAY
jgi:hypothetical protein